MTETFGDSAPADDRSTPSVEEATTLHVARARAGDGESLAWVVTRFSPLLLVAARYRLGRVLGALYDPEDLVSDVWVVALPRLPDLSPRDGRLTPVVVRFLTTTLRNKVDNLVQKHITGKPARIRAAPDADGEVRDVLEAIPAEVTSVVGRMARRELGDLVLSTLESLDDADREIVILRGLEQHSYREIAAILRVEPGTLSVRYSRAIAKLRREIPRSIFEELESE